MILHPETNYMRFIDNTQTTGIKNLIMDVIPYLLSKNIKMEDIKLLELGVFNGESTFMFSSCIKNIVTVDPWIKGYDDETIACTIDMKKVKENFMYLNGANIISGIIKHYQKTSDEYFAEESYDKNFDIIYIDASHTYESFSKDLKNSLNLNPYVIAGHDYHIYDIAKLLNESLPDKNIKIYEDNSWVINLR